MCILRQSFKGDNVYKKRIWHDVYHRWRTIFTIAKIPRLQIWLHYTMLQMMTVTYLIQGKCTNWYRTVQEGQGLQNMESNSLKFDKLMRNWAHYNICKIWSWNDAKLLSPFYQCEQGTCEAEASIRSDCSRYKFWKGYVS